MQTMMATFEDEFSRDAALTAAIDKNINVAYVGSVTPLAHGKRVGEPAPIVIFLARGPSDGLHFMQNGASVCTQL